METKTFLLTTSFYPPYHLGGDAIHVAYLSRELATRGHEVHVLHSIDAYTLKRGKIHANPMNRDGVYTHPCKSAFGILSPISAYALGRSPQISKTFSAIVRKISPDIVHHHNISLLGMDLLKRRGPYINLHTAHDHWLLCARNDMLYKGKEICNSKSCLSCTLASGRILQPWRISNRLRNHLGEVDKIIAPSRNLKSLLAQEFSNGISQIYNFAPEPPQEISNVDFDDFFLFVGALEEHKGILLLMEAFQEANVSSRLVIAGSGRLRGYIDKKSRTKGLRGRVLILDGVSRHRLYQLYKNARALVLPSVCFENCPLVLLEALSVGTPILGSNLGGIQEVIRLSQSGIVFDCSPLRIMESIEDISHDRISHKRFSENAKKSYSKWFSPTAFMRAYEDEIQELSLV